MKRWQTEGLHPRQGVSVFRTELNIHSVVLFHIEFGVWSLECTESRLVSAILPKLYSSINSYL